MLVVSRLTGLCKCSADVTSLFREKGVWKVFALDVELLPISPVWV